jgi:hypothetical protein
VTKKLVLLYWLGVAALGVFALTVERRFPRRATFITSESQAESNCSNLVAK